MANLNSGPFSDIWQLGARDSWLSLLRLVVIVADAESQANLWKMEVSEKKTVPRCLPISCKYTKAKGRISCLEVLCRFEIVDDPPLASKLRNSCQGLVFDLMLLSVKEDEVSPTCKESNIGYITKSND